MHKDVKRFDRLWGDKETRPEARKVAEKYIKDHESDLAEHLGGKSLEELVGMIKSYRAAGREEDRIIADMWLLVKFPPQKITGSGGMGAIPFQEIFKTNN